MKRSRIRWWIVTVWLAGASGVLFGCDDSEYEDITDGSMPERGPMEAGTESQFDAQSARSNEAGSDSASNTSTSQLACSPTLSQFDDSGVNKFIYDQYHDSEWAPASLLVFCFTKGVDCTQYKIDIKSSVGIGLIDSTPIDSIDRLHIGPGYISYILTDDEKVPSDLVQKIRSQANESWIAEISGASITDVYLEYCRYGIVLRGPLSIVQFENRPGTNRNETDYAVLKDKKGNVVFEMNKK